MYTHICLHTYIYIHILHSSGLYVVLCYVVLCSVMYVYRYLSVEVQGACSTVHPYRLTPPAEHYCPILLSVTAEPRHEGALKS